MKTLLRIVPVKLVSFHSNWGEPPVVVPSYEVQVSDDLMEMLVKASHPVRRVRQPRPDTDPRQFSSFFEQFWAAYPLKRGKAAAWKAWHHMKPRVETQVLLDAIERHKQTEQWKRDGGQYIPHPATWLNQRRWEDELPVTNNVHGTEGDYQR